MASFLLRGCPHFSSKGRGVCFCSRLWPNVTSERFNTDSIMRQPLACSAVDGSYLTCLPACRILSIEACWNGWSNCPITGSYSESPGLLHLVDNQQECILNQSWNSLPFLTGHEKALIIHNYGLQEQGRGK